MYVTYADGNMTKLLAIPITESRPAPSLKICPTISLALCAALARISSAKLDSHIKETVNELSKVR